MDPKVGYSLRFLFPAIAVILGLLQAWEGRHLMNPDGISYLDIADAYRRGDWHSALNTYWNPFYPWILSASLAILRPSPQWEFPVVHVINFGIYVAALCCFHFFLRHLITYDQQLRKRDGDPDSANIPELVWWSVGYTVFMLFSLEWIGLEVVSPDMCVAAFIFLAAGLVLRLRSGQDASWISFALGLCLGLSYLAKVASAFPVVACFILAGGVTRRKGVWRRLAMICLGVLLTAGPYVLALSQRQARFTLSDAGTLNYAWYVNAVPNHWLGELPGLGVPVNPHRKILEFPAAYAYDPVAPGTYPGWFDPAYWYDGVKPRLNVARQLYAIKGNSELLFEWLFSGVEAVLVAGMLTLYLLFGKWRLISTAVRERWFLLAPAVLTMGMYGLIWVESRFFGAVLTLLWMGLLSGVRLPGGREARAVLQCVVAAMVTVPLGSVAGMVVIDAYEIGQEPSKDWRVAEFLHTNGIRPGDRVAVIGHVNRCGWARLAGVKITAEIPAESEGNFDTADEVVQSRAVAALFATGVRAIVADHPVTTGCPTGWRAAPETGFHMCAVASGQ